MTDRGGGPAGLSRAELQVLGPHQHARLGRPRRARPLDAAELDDAARQRIGVAVEAVDPAEELGDEGVRRGAVQRLRVADLNDRAGVHDRQAIGDRERLVLVVGDMHGGDAEPAQQLGELVAQRFLQLGVERGERFVEQQHARPHRDRTGEGDALPLPARKLGRTLGLEAVETHQIDQLADRATALGLVDAAHEQAIADVRRDRHLREQRVALEHHADAALLHRPRGHVLVAEADPAAGIGRLQAGEQAQQRRLAATRGAEQGNHLAGLDGQRRGFEAAGAVGIGLGAVDDLDARPFELHGQVTFRSVSAAPRRAPAGPRARAG